MHPEVFQRFEEICQSRGARGRVLEIGAVPSADTLLCLPAIRTADQRIGINIDGPHVCDGFEIVKVNANRMDCFRDSSFDTVLCNSMLEHDKYFWKTLSEIRRVAKSGALVVLGVPGYSNFDLASHLRELTRIPFLGRFLRRRIEELKSATLTLPVHNYPGDYWRFSNQAVEQVFFEGMTSVNVTSLMIPPRIIGSGIMP